MKQIEAINIFSERLKSYLKRSKIKQVYLASVLKVTPSAICQMVQCRILMSQNQLQIICKNLKLTDEETLELQTLLAKIRVGEINIISPFNRYMKSRRLEAKLSIAKLSNLCGISLVRLRSFEEDLSADFTYADAEKLSKIYNCTPEFLLKKLPSFESHDVVYEYPSANTGRLEAADNSAAYSDLKKVPLLELNAMKQYSGNADLMTFGQVSCNEEIDYCIEKSVIAIKMKSSVIDFSVPGELVLFVSDKKPFIFVSKLFLGMDKEKNFYLLQKFEGKDDFYTCKADAAAEVFTEKLVWTIGIYEVKFNPKMLV
ncbi:MAG: helix-turn-helix transcriptional regulator [Lentisphaeria bacterium]|nr:helix-turn-helix transcriptional regulator [Lentisphaeria bacterium]